MKAQYFIRLIASGNFFMGVDTNYLAETCYFTSSAKAYKTQRGAIRSAEKHATHYPDLFRGGFQILSK